MIQLSLPTFYRLAFLIAGLIWGAYLSNAQMIAKALGIKVPTSILLRADELIE